MTHKDGWHIRLIDQIESRLKYLKNYAEISVNKGNSPGSDIQITIKKTNKKINIEIQQFASGAPWKSGTIPKWRERHKDYTLIIFPMGVLESVLKKIPEHNEYKFFDQEGVFLFADTQLSEIISLTGFLVLVNL